MESEARIIRRRRACAVRILLCASSRTIHGGHDLSESRASEARAAKPLDKVLAPEQRVGLAGCKTSAGSFAPLPIVLKIIFSGQQEYIDAICICL